MKIFYSLSLAFIIFFQGANISHTRPSVRSLQKGAHNLENTRRATYSSQKTDTKAFRDPIVGVTGTYPSTWNKSSLKSEDYNHDILIFTDKVYKKSSLSIRMKLLDHPVTQDDLQKDFADYSQQPENEYQRLNMSYLQEFQLFESESIQWKNLPAVTHTFQYRSASKTYKTKHVRIGTGNKIYILTYSSSVKDFEKDMHYFDNFLQSLKIINNHSNLSDPVYKRASDSRRGKMMERRNARLRRRIK